MSLAAVLAGSEAAAEAAARAGTYEAAQRRIRSIEAHQGVAAPPGSYAPSPQEAAKHASAAIHAPSLLEDIPFVGPAVSSAKSALQLAESPLGAAAGAAAEPIAEGLVGLVKPIALKLTLYAVLILGGIALAGYGLATALRPEPPKLRLSTLAKAGELAAA